MYSIKVGTNVLKNTANAGPNGETMATPSGWTKSLPPKVKGIFFGQSINNNFFSCISVIAVWSSWFDILCMISTVQSNGTLAKSDLTEISMVELENALVLAIIEYMKFWKSSVDDTIWTILNNFNANIQLTYKMGQKSRLPFLDVLHTGNGNNIVTTVYCKTTINDLHLNWNSFIPTNAYLI